MSKNTFQDILPPEKRSIRDIPLPVRSPRKSVKAPKAQKSRGEKVEVHEAEPEEIEYAKEHVDADYEPEMPHEITEKRSYGKIFFFLGLIAAVAVFIYFSTSLFSGATVKVTPNSFSGTIDAQGVATRESDVDGLHYDLITVEREGRKVVEASTTNNVSIKATGKITVYNNFSAQTQSLVKNTRFETSGGLIFRTDKAIVIPGMKNGAPGTIEITVIADEAGDKYNIQPSDFTIPGFKSDEPRYKGFYAKSKDAFSGGFVGVSGSITAADRLAAQQSIEAELMESLEKEITSQKPDTFVLYKDAILSSKEVLSDENASSDPTKKTVTVRTKVVLYGIIFNKEELSAYVSANATGKPEGREGPFDVANLEDLTFTLVNKPSFSATSSSNATFTLKGNPVILSHVDIEKLRADLSGKTVKSAQNLLSSGYPMIQKMEFIIRPFWKNTLPTDPNKMVIETITQ